MLEYGSVPGLPGKYRITLAISIALLLHTLVMSALPFALPEQEPRHRTVRVELVSPGSEPSPETVTSAQPAETRENSHTQTGDQTDDSQPSSRPEILTRDSFRQEHTEAGEPPQPSTPQQTSDQPSAQSSPSQTSTSTAAGNPDATTENSPEPVTQISRRPQETDPYLASLAARVAGELDKRPVPSSGRVKEPATMELELQLMGSGALTSAKVTRSTGFREIDQAVYRAALLASPYPEPPEKHSGRKRFRVELIFTPERL